MIIHNIFLKNLLEYLRQFVLNFGKCLKQGEFVSESAPPTRTLYKHLPTFEKEMQRVKKDWKYWIRRIIGIPNVRLRYEKKGDFLFTYGTLLVTNKPYCAYLETGLSFYNYDLGISKNPLARLIVGLLATRKNCQKLIFLSEAARKSFFSTLSYPKKTRRILQEKSMVIYPVPLIEKISHPPKRWHDGLKLLFVGMYYMKGGVELVKAFERIGKEYPKTELTIVTPVHTMKEGDIAHLKTIPGLTLLDATLGGEEMQALYKSHDIFCLPTYRDGFGLVLIEAIAHGMPLIITDQYATSEMAIHGENGFVFKGHPLLDYDPETYALLGKYYNPKDFYQNLFRFQEEGRLKPVEDFIYGSAMRFLSQKSLLEDFSKRSLRLYDQKFHPDHIGRRLESVFLEALEK